MVATVRLEAMVSLGGVVVEFDPRAVEKTVKERGFNHVENQNRDQNQIRFHRVYGPPRHPMAWSANHLLEDDYFDFKDLDIEEPLVWRGPVTPEVELHLVKKENERLIKGFSLAKNKMKEKCKKLEEELKQMRMINNELDAQNKEHQTTTKNNIINKHKKKRK